VTTGPQGLWRDEGHHYFVSALLDDDHWVEVGPLASVTTVLDPMKATGPLVGWAKREVAAAALRNLDRLAEMVKESGVDSAAKWLTSIPDYKRDTAAYAGSEAHLIAEAYANGQVIHASVASPKVRQYLAWSQLWQPRYVGIEMMVVNFTHGYAGTGDLWADLPTGAGSEWATGRYGEKILVKPGEYELWLLDIKTGNLAKGPYDEHWLQLAGLHGAKNQMWTGSPGKAELTPAPRATRFGILHLAEDKATLWEGQVGPAEFETFLASKRAYDWLTERAKSVRIGRVERKSA
jgi:hypothetical protein